MQDLVSVHVIHSKWTCNVSRFRAHVILFPWNLFILIMCPGYITGQLHFNTAHSVWSTRSPQLFSIMESHLGFGEARITAGWAFHIKGQMKFKSSAGRESLACDLAAASCFRYCHITSRIHTNLIPGKTHRSPKSAGGWWQRRNVIQQKPCHRYLRKSLYVSDKCYSYGNTFPCKTLLLASRSTRHGSQPTWRWDETSYEMSRIKVMS